jgi:hypothetical protein
VIAADVKEKYTGDYETSSINCRVNLDLDELKKEEAGYRPLPVYYDFGDHKEAVLTDNFKRINREIAHIIQKHQPPKVNTPKATMKEQLKNNRK